jgi:hypothetical protein
MDDMNVTYRETNEHFVILAPKKKIEDMSMVLRSYYIAKDSMQLTNVISGNYRLSFKYDNLNNLCFYHFEDSASVMTQRIKWRGDKVIFFEDFQKATMAMNELFWESVRLDMDPRDHIYFKMYYNMRKMLFTLGRIYSPS